MKKHLSILLSLLLLWTSIIPGLAEEAAEPPLAQVTNGSRTMDFRYPANCEMEEDGSFGTFVHLNDDAYVVVVLLEDGKSVTQFFEESKAPDMEILWLSEEIQLLAWHNNMGYGFPGWPVLDIVEVGVTLADGSSVIVQSTCLAGNTEIYDVLTVILSSVTDAQPLQDWLEDTWLPLASSCEESP